MLEEDKVLVYFIRIFIIVGGIGATVAMIGHIGQAEGVDKYISIFVCITMLATFLLFKPMFASIPYIYTKREGHKTTKVHVYEFTLNPGAPRSFLMHDLDRDKRLYNILNYTVVGNEVTIKSSSPLDVTDAHRGLNTYTPYTFRIHHYTETVVTPWQTFK